MVLRHFELSEKVKAYDPRADIELIDRAYVFAMQSHGTQLRESGDPYFHHPVEVAGILAAMRLDTATIVTALLHDTVEDTLATLDEIRKLFGAEIAKLVDGVTKLSKIELQSENTRQAENFRKLVLAMSNDLRVLLVKLADRLHNMRTLHFVKSEAKRKRIARETLEIYVPLAERIGIQHIKDELEDLAFSQLNPDSYASIVSRLNMVDEESNRSIVAAIIDELEATLEKEDLKGTVSGRMKRPYSIWRKMCRQNVSIEQLSDIMAFRIIVDSVSDCYNVLGVLHSYYRVQPGRFKDYISTPKPNHYQSLHTTLFGPQHKKIEIQIRTYAMDEVAEYGIAAHWQYKQGKTGDTNEKEKISYRWIKSLLEILENAAGPEEFLEHTKLEMFQDQVFVFSPQGDVAALPRGATPVDFAYAIHSAVGNNCVAAKVNGRLTPLRTALQNGDQVEIITSKSQTPSPSWERFVVTGKARANIRRFIRTQQRDQYIELGKSLLHRAFHQEHLDYSEKVLGPVFAKYNVQTLEDLQALLGEGQITTADVLRCAFPQHTSKKGWAELLPLSSPTSKPSSEKAVSIRGLIPGMAIHYAGCCHPLPGDRIVGIVVSGQGVTIHTEDCENLENFSQEPDRWIEVSWETPHSHEKYIGRLLITIHNRPGALAALTTVISRNQANILNLKITHRMETFWDLFIDIEVNHTDQLNAIMAALRASSYVHSVSR